MQNTDSAEVSAEECWSVHGLEQWLQTPMITLSFVWLALVIAELVWGETDLLAVFGTAIWAIFILEFAVRLSIAPDKRQFLNSNWLTLIALIVPAFRILAAFRVFQFARFLRGVRLVQIVGTANRGMNALRRSLGRRGLGYVLATTALVALLGAAGMMAFEPATKVPGGFEDFADALWWTGMVLTTMGSAFWPTTEEGRVLCLLLSIYGFTTFGYITASFATFFIGVEAQTREGDVPGKSDIADLREEIARLRTELQLRKW
jgi:voltage-gated potassium channel